jgi:hypothetical protein
LSEWPQCVGVHRISLGLIRSLRWRWVWGLVLLLALIAWISLWGSEAGKHQAKLQPVVVSERLVREHPTISCGIHVDQIYELNLNSRTFTADGQFWLVWPASVQELMTTHATTPLDLVRMLNRIETWDSTFEVATPSPIPLSGGRHYQLYTFSSRFYDDSISFRRDPFDSLSLPIILQAGQPWMANKYADVRMIPERPMGALVGESGELSGYERGGASFKPYLHRATTRFGGWFQPVMAQMRLEMVYRSNVWSALVNWVLPLMIVNSIVLMAPSVEGSLGDVRLAIPSTALLTLIFLQQSYHSSLPRLPYSTLLDDLFACSYVVAMTLFGLFVWGTNLYTAAAVDQQAMVMERINRMDRRFQWCSLLAFVLVGAFSWWRP